MFRMSVQYEYADCLAQIKLHYRTAGKASRVGQLLLAACLLAEIVYAFVIAIPKHGFIPEIAVVLVLCALGIVFLMLTPQLNALKLHRQYKQFPTQEMTFDEEKVLIRGKHSQGSFEYTHFKSIYHTKDAYYLLSGGKDILDIPERCFVEGDPAAFGAFLAEKTGLEVKELN